MLLSCVKKHANLLRGERSTLSMIHRESRASMKPEGLTSIPLYPEERECQSPSAPRILEIFADAQRHHLVSDGQIVKVFDPELPAL